MRLLVLAAAAALVAGTASAASLTSTIAKIDTKNRVLYLSDRTAMIVGAEVDLTQLRPAMRVQITANMDEDGFSPASAVTPVK